MAAASAPGVLLAIDAGSSRTRATLLSPAGETLASAAAPTPSRRGVGGEAVVDGHELWHELTTLIREVAAGAEVAAIGVTAQLGLVLVDESGAPLTDVLLWSDTRAAAVSAPVTTRLASHAPVLGRRPSAELGAARLAWWRAERPGTLAAARWVLSLKDLLVLRLTGAAVTDPTHASYTGWFDVHARAYDDALIAAAGVDARLLPEVRGATEAAGGLSAHAAAALGLEAGTAVAVGGPDGTVGTLGAGALGPGATVDVAGTTDVLLAVVDAPRWTDADGAVLNAHGLPGRWLVGGPTGMTGGAVEWVARMLGFASTAAALEAYDDAALALPVGAEGLSFNTALSGGRMPSWTPDERGLLAGLAEHHGPAHLLRAAHEGAAFAVLEGIEALRAAGATVDEITIVGGAGRQERLVALRSVLWDVPVRVAVGAEATTAEATTLGAALLAGLAGGLYRSLEAAAAALVPRSRRVAPLAIDRGEVAAARARWASGAAFARGRR